MKKLYDGTEVSDDVPTRNTSKGRFLLTQSEIDELKARDAEQSLKIADYEAKIKYKDERLRAYAERGATILNVLEALWEKVMEDRSEKADALEVIKKEVKLLYPKPTKEIK